MDARLVNERNYLMRAIDRDREELRHAVDRLKRLTTQKVEALRVGHYVAGRPLPYLIGGFLFGLWLGWSRTEDL